MTKNRRRLRANWAVAIFVAAYFFLAIAPARAQLDETCTVTVNGQTVNVGFGGEFRIPNIPATGNLVRAYAICTKGGKTRYGRSGFFQIRPNEAIALSELDMVFRDTPFPTTSAIRALAVNAVLTAIGQTTPVRVIATLSDSTQKEVTGRGFGSTYLTSNPNVATVNEQGVVTATGAGSVLITVNNEGATAVARIAVSPPSLSTTVEGIVQYENRAPAVGATLVIPGHGESIITSTDGRFSFTGVLSSLGPFRVRAYQIVNNQLRLGVTGRLRTITGGVTDAGIIVIKPTTNLVYWTTPVSGSWDDATKWSTGVVPGANDSVFIGVPGNITVTYSQGATTIKSLLCDEDFIISGGNFFSLTDSSEITGNLTLSAGTLAGSGALAIFKEFRWSGGRIEGNGTIDVATSGTMLFSGGLNTVSQRIINNTGTILCNGNIALDNGAIINNLTSAVFNLQTDVNITGFPVTTAFNNAGSFIKSGGLGTTRFVNVLFRSTSTININTGVLGFDNGGSSTGGVINVSNGARLDLIGISGSFIWSGTIGSGAGSVRLVTGTLQIGAGGAAFNFPNGGFLFSGGSITGSGTVTNNGIFNWSGGTINGPGILTNNGIFNWSGGTINGPGTLTNAGNFSIAGNNDKFFKGGATINNSGTMTWIGAGRILGGEGAVFNNLASGIFDIQVNTSFLGDILGGTRTAFNNVGTIIKSTGTGITDLNVTFNNANGAMNVQTGTLFLSAGGTNTGGTYAIADTANLSLSAGNFNHTGGTINVTSGVLNLSSGTHKFSGNYSGSGVGVIRLSGGTLQIDTNIVATFNFTGGGFQWSNFGTITGPGTLNNAGNFSIAGNNDKFFKGGATINNFGTMTWIGAGRILGGEGAVFNNLASGIFDIQVNTSFLGDILGATRTAFNNVGTVIKSAGTGITDLNVTFNNANGAMNVQTGTLFLSAGGTNTGGTYSIADTANLNLSAGNFNYTGGTITVTKGALNLSGGTHKFSGNYSGAGAGLIQLAGGTLQIDPAIVASFNFTGGGFQWTSGGNINGPGTLNNAGNFSIAGNNDKFFKGGATINNSGTMTWIGAGRILGGEGAVFNNLASGIFDIQVNTSFLGDILGATRTAFNNVGTVIKSTSTGTIFLDVTFNNSGSVQAQSGTLSFTSGFTQTAGATILNGGTLSSSTTLNIQGGSVSGVGNITANVVSSGQFSPGASPGILNITGTYTQNRPPQAGTLNIELNGTATNQFDQLKMNGAATLGGTLNLIPTPNLNLGDSFVIMTFSGRGGTQFDNVTGQDIGGGRRLNVIYNLTNVTVQVAAGGLER